MSYFDFIERFPETIFDRSTDSRLARLWKLLSDELDTIAGVLDAMLTLRSIEDSEGAQLDQIGKILKVERDYMSDDDYRLMLNLAKAKLRAHGTIPLLNQIIAAMFPDRFLYLNLLEDGSATRRYDGTWDYDGSYYWDGIPASTAGFEVVMNEQKYNDVRLQKLEAQLKIIKAAGVRAQVVKGDWNGTDNTGV